MEIEAQKHRGHEFIFVRYVRRCLRTRVLWPWLGKHPPASPRPLSTLPDALIGEMLEVLDLLTAKHSYDEVTGLPAG